MSMIMTPMAMLYLLHQMKFFPFLSNSDRDLFIHPTSHVNNPAFGTPLSIVDICQCVVGYPRLTSFTLHTKKQFIWVLQQKLHTSCYRNATVLLEPVDDSVEPDLDEPRLRHAPQGPTIDQGVRGTDLYHEAEGKYRQILIKIIDFIPSMEFLLGPENAKPIPKAFISFPRR